MIAAIGHRAAGGRHQSASGSRSLATAGVSGATMARGFNNSAQVRIATAMKAAIEDAARAGWLCIERYVKRLPRPGRRRFALRFNFWRRLTARYLHP